MSRKQAPSLLVSCRTSSALDQPLFRKHYSYHHQRNVTDGSYDTQRNSDHSLVVEELSIGCASQHPF